MPMEILPRSAATFLHTGNYSQAIRTPSLLTFSMAMEEATDLGPGWGSGEVLAAILGLRILNYFQDCLGKHNPDSGTTLPTS